MNGDDKDLKDTPVHNGKTLPVVFARESYEPIKDRQTLFKEQYTKQVAHTIPPHYILYSEK